MTTPFQSSGGSVEESTRLEMIKGGTYRFRIVANEKIFSGGLNGSFTAKLYINNVLVMTSPINTGSTGQMQEVTGDFAVNAGEEVYIKLEHTSGNSTNSQALMIVGVSNDFGYFSSTPYFRDIATENTYQLHGWYGGFIG